MYLTRSQFQSDQTYSAYLKAAKILEVQFKKHPQHPGVAHYLIHSYDAPPIAKQGIPAARRSAQIAPDAPHALHMPSHIFTRVGEWADSAATYRRSADAALKSKEPDQAAHALDYAAYAYLQLGRDSEARKATDEVLGYKGFNPNIFTGSYAAAAIAARSGDAASAEKDLERIAALGEQLKEAKNAYWGGEVEVMRLTAAGWIALAQGRDNKRSSTRSPPQC